MKIGIIAGIALLVLGCGDGSNHANKGANAATGAANSGGGSSGSGGQAEGGKAGGEPAEPPLARVNDCDNLPTPGVFEEITPPTVKANIVPNGATGTKGGTFAMVVDPVNQGTVYAGTKFQGVWKSTNCGADWTKVNTGLNGEDVGRGMNWTFDIDPQKPEIVYTNSGYGSNGLFKSLDGGVNWTDVWSKKSQPELGASFQYNFANVIAIDPANHVHILLTFHEACLAPHPSTCIAESMDGGSSWHLIDGEPEWNGNEGQVIFFLENSSTWLWGSQTNGFWRTGNSGDTWEQIPGMNTSHLQGSQLLRTQDGSFFAAGAEGIWRSSDGKADNWKLVPNTGPIVGGLVTDGTTMYASTCYFGGFCMKARYLKSAETDGDTWTEIESPEIPMGGNMGFDKAHKLLYSSNIDEGMWRVVVE